MAKQIKSFIDIQPARLTDDELRSNNIGSFKEGDFIQISRKIDGSNASITYDEETGALVCFSRRVKLKWDRTLNGFYNYVQTLNPDDFKDSANLYIFGEWDLGCNKIKTYKDEYKKSWIVYDIFNKETDSWCGQGFVKLYCVKHHLRYIQSLYEGPFIGWEHVQSFLENDGYYGDTAEGIVIKNQTALKRNASLSNSEQEKHPAYLKIVNESFKESMKRKPKIVNPIAEVEKEEQRSLAESIVTERRVEKALERLRDDGIIPAKCEPKDMGTVAKNLPKSVYDDCVKEEKEVVLKVGESFGKLCAQISMKIARERILGK